MPEISSAMRSAIEDISQRITEFRHHLHQNPELSGKERMTKEFILKNIPKNEYIVVMESADTHGFWIDLLLGGGGGVVAMRADMDALPICEETGLSYASKNAGVMHACGHDTHTAMLWGALITSIENREALAASLNLSSLRFIFQASEELAPGGAKPLVENGCLAGVKYIFGQHVMPNLPSGRAGFCTGGVMAAVNDFELTLSGKGGHAAKPDEANDLVLLASEIVVSAQKIVSRNVNPMVPAVVSVCQLNAGTASNILPAKASMVGTIRSLDRSLREFLPKRFEEIVKFKCMEHGASYGIKWIEGYPVTHNDAAATSIHKAAAEKVFGKNNVVDPADRSMGAEDFAYYAEKVPGSFAFLGCGKEPGEENFPLHHPKFSVADSDVIGGTMLFAEVICSFKR